MIVSVMSKAIPCRPRECLERHFSNTDFNLSRFGMLPVPHISEPSINMMTNDHGMGSPFIINAVRIPPDAERVTDADEEV